MRKTFIVFFIFIFSTGKMITQSTWEKLELPKSNFLGGALYCLDENRLFFWDNSAWPRTFYKSSDGGKSWKSS